MLTTTCPSCSEHISGRDALCEDWRDPERAFGCPHCGTYFISDPKTNMALFGQGYLRGIARVFLFIYGVAALLALWRLYQGDPIDTSVIVLPTLFFLIVAAYLRINRPEQSLVESPYQPGLKDARDLDGNNATLSPKL